MAVMGLEIALIQAMKNAPIVAPLNGPWSAIVTRTALVKKRTHLAIQKMVYEFFLLKNTKFLSLN